MRRLISPALPYLAVRVLLDEQLPADLARLLPGHAVSTVALCGWAGVKNGELLRRIRGAFDALVMMDRGIPHQHNLATLEFGILLVRARTNRLRDIQPLLPDILDGLSNLTPGTVVEVGTVR